MTVVTFKLVENVPEIAAETLRRAGHEAHTAQDEGLAGAPDEQIAKSALREGRVLLTLDKDFSDIRRHPPSETPGIVVLRPRAPTPATLRHIVAGLLPLLARESLEGRLWVADEQRVRIWPASGGHS